MAKCYATIEYIKKWCCIMRLIPYMCSLMKTQRDKSMKWMVASKLEGPCT